ncbi:phage protease [Endozoicomonas gorgoniicola]|uniref:Phage protease n=1 Tax=Endozoicomonas gorgoniicola TaxID=1234144 RepID=A0ABT3MYJ6_9GAMM|nr:phage protease [Endozoicomonas gorgoniicola]MCW7554440.1 phage protease [Endozoicomonas gorgoniicola]
MKQKIYLALNSEQEQDRVAVDLALNFQLTESGQAPEWLPLIPAGQFSGQDGRTWHNSTPEAVLARTRNVGRDVPWDIEHQPLTFTTSGRS